MTPEEYAKMSIATRIRNMKIPTKYGDVDRFLDEVFDQALPSNDDELSATQLAGTIKGGTSHEVYYHRPDKSYSNEYPTLRKQQYQTLPRHYDNGNTYGNLMIF